MRLEGGEMAQKKIVFVAFAIDDERQRDFLDVLQRLKTVKAAPRTARQGREFRRRGQNPIDELVLRQDVTLLHPSDLTFAGLVDHFVTLNRLSCTTELTKMLLGTDPFLDGTVILLQDVIQILNWTVPATSS